MPDAAYWREYRRKHRDRIRAQEADRRRNSGRLRAQRHAQEQRRRARRRLEQEAKASVVVLTGHVLFDRAREVLRSPRPGRLLRWYQEVDFEDDVMTFVLAALEQRDPREAVRAARAARKEQRGNEVPMMMDGLDAGHRLWANPSLEADHGEVEGQGRAEGRVR